MFFMMGIFPKEEQLYFEQYCICNSCGREGEITVFKVSQTLSLFFIPVWRWGTRYYARMSCCGTTVELDPEIGKGIEKGDITYLDPSIFPYRNDSVCPACGHEIKPEDNYCPHCGRRL